MPNTAQLALAKLNVADFFFTSPLKSYEHILQKKCWLDPNL